VEGAGAGEGGVGLANVLSRKFAELWGGKAKRLSPTARRRRNAPPLSAAQTATREPGSRTSSSRHRNGFSASEIPEVRRDTQATRSARPGATTRSCSSCPGDCNGYAIVPPNSTSRIALSACARGVRHHHQSIATVVEQRPPRPTNRRQASDGPVESARPHRRSATSTATP
jgi:hypothetical protein